ncbi:hypothetical protein AAGF08_13500 [Algoriphagus sp. SE2]|uniref:hypothetical protein n=1 Tax=Algoriphagus sp. SE2 TaxID=3141536 RepID=UPI0031CD9647
MKLFKFILLFSLGTCLVDSINAQVKPQPITNDTIILAQAYMNLYLTETFYDTLDRDRISKILAFEKDELGKIKNRSFISSNNTLYNFTQSIFYYLQTKRITQERKEFERNLLRRIKSIFEQSIEAYNNAEIEDFETFTKQKSALYEMISFDEGANNELKQEIWKLKNELNSKFNEDIYPDFKRIFNRSKRNNQFDFDSLTYFTKLYGMPLSMAILENESNFKFISFNSNHISPQYVADNRLELISRYMQLKSLAIKKTRSPRNFNTAILYQGYDDFMDRLQFEEDEFIKKELNPKVCALLLSQLESKYPREGEEKGLDEPIAFIGSPSTEKEPIYFFPNPAPLASASLIREDFKPELRTLNQVDLLLKSDLENAGFKNQLHYYYDLDGFALTTSLEKFNINGASLPSDKRFTKNIGGEGKFSYFEIFKSIFFDVESEYRMFAFIVASKAASMNNQVMTVNFAEDLIKNSYDSLPKVLKDRVLNNKTLSIFVYHFHQNDIGQVPELDLGGSLSVKDHLKNAGITEFVQ